jgi:hypothetical protein
LRRCALRLSGDDVGEVRRGLGVFPNNVWESSMSIAIELIVVVLRGCVNSISNGEGSSLM